MQSLLSNNKQLIFTSSVSFRELKGIKEHLMSCFAIGLVLDIQPYDIESRKKIVKCKAEEMHLVIEEHEINEIAKYDDYGIRSIEGALNTFAVYGITYSLAKQRKYEDRASQL